MSKKLPVVSWKDMERAYEALGFVFVRSKGSHRSYARPDDPDNILVLVKHKELAKGTVSQNLRKLGISKEQFIELLNKKFVHDHP